MSDPEKLKAREAKFGKSLLSVKDPKDPDLMKKRAEKFKSQGLAAVTSKDDEARKKVWWVWILSLHGGLQCQVLVRFRSCMEAGGQSGMEGCGGGRSRGEARAGMLTRL